MCVSVLFQKKRKKRKRKTDFWFELILLHLPVPWCLLWCSTSVALVSPFLVLRVLLDYGGVVAGNISTEGPGELCLCRAGSLGGADTGAMRSVGSWVCQDNTGGQGAECWGVDC